MFRVGGLSGLGRADGERVAPDTGGADSDSVGGAAFASVIASNAASADPGATLKMSEVCLAVGRGVASPVDSGSSVSGVDVGFVEYVRPTGRPVGVLGALSVVGFRESPPRGRSVAAVVLPEDVEPVEPVDAVVPVDADAAV